MAHKDILLLALDALVADGPTGITYQHMFVCHGGDHDACGDGCDTHGAPERLTALVVAAEVLLPILLSDPFQCGDHVTWPAWYVRRALDCALGSEPD